MYKISIFNAAENRTRAYLSLSIFFVVTEFRYVAQADFYALRLMMSSAR